LHRQHSRRARSPRTSPAPGDGGGGSSIGGNGEPGNGTPLGRLVDSAGFFPAAFGREPDPMRRQRPDGNLGPKYTIRYRVPGPNNEDDLIVQDAYPYATPSPVTFMRPGQPFFGTERTRGGWFVAGAELRQLVLGAATASTAPHDTTGASSSVGPWRAVAGLALALMAAAAGLVAVRRREASPAR
jgi:hypothetical protein